MQLLLVWFRKYSMVKIIWRIATLAYLVSTNALTFIHELKSEFIDFLEVFILKYLFVIEQFNKHSVKKLTMC